MEFADKYELIESITTGAVETFIADHKGRDERVLAHIFHCEPQRPNQPTVQWVMEGFRKVAPEPVGLVLETGRYSGTLYAYLVTKLPDATALQGWVQRYNSQLADTSEIAKADAKPVAKDEPPAAPAPAPEVPPEVPPKEPEPAHVPVQFTQIFRNFESQAKHSPPVAPVTDVELPPRSVPSLDDPGHPSGLQAAPRWDTLDFQSPAPKEEIPKERPKASSPGSSFTSEYAVKNFASDPIAPANRDNAKPGEFTSFFQGPFRPDGPAETPSVSSTPSEPLRKSEGNFTEMFRSVPVQPERPFASSVLAGPVSARKDAPGTGFTGWFSDPGILDRTPDTPAPPAPAPLSRTASGPPPVFSTPSKEPPVLAQPPEPLAPPIRAFSPPPTPIPTVAKPSPVTPSSAPDGATRVFSPPVSEPASLSPPPLAGPSPYTQIISVRPTSPSEDEASAEHPAEGKLPAFAPPAKPTLPKITPPPMPKMAPPPMPKIAPPAPPAGLKAPKAPKVDISKMDAPKPPVSYWPLVLTLTALLFIAVLVVLYFVLKH